MSSSNDNHSNIDDPLYNSRVIKNYVEYVKKFHPGVNIDSVLSFAGISTYELDDQGHWFSQRQVDRFHEILTQKTEDPNISRKVGRFAAYSAATGILRQYALGFITPASAYRMLEKFSYNVSRAFTLNMKQIASNKIEVIVRPKAGVKEKPYQCANRIGLLEAVSKVFTNKFAKIEHPVCIHNGGDSERYVITWEKSLSLIWKPIRNYFLLASVLASLALYFSLPIMSWIIFILSCALLSMVFSFYFERLDNMELSKAIEAQGDAAKDHLDEINIRYNNALLVQEIGQATSTILDIDDLFDTVVGIMERRLDFDRGMIMLANDDRTRLVYHTGYGYGNELEGVLQGLEFHLDNPKSRGVLVLAFKEQQPFLVNNVAEIQKDMSKRSREFVKQMGIKSLICVPIVYETESLGILTVDNMQSKRLLTQSDVSLLMGVASQTAVSIINARSFQRLQESEKKYRELVENANSIILRMDTKGNITFFNEFAQKFFGYSEDEIRGRNVKGTILADIEETEHGLENLVMSLQQNPQQQFVSEHQNVTRNGSEVWVAWTYRPIFDRSGQFVEVLSIGNDITELRRAERERKVLEAQLQHAQRMEAIGTLAGGIAHDFNNILGAIIGYTEMSLYDTPDGSKTKSNMEEVLKAGHRAKDLVHQILAFSRQSEQERQPVQIHLIVKEALKLLRASLPSTIEIRQNIGTNMGSVLADPTQIHQVMMNLCTNAHHAMRDKGGVLEIGLSAVDLDESESVSFPDLYPGPYLKLSVSDTGYGMDRNIIEKIFDPYFTTKEKGVGTGLGLAVVHGIVKSHGGTISVQSELGKGTTFDVLFPRIDSDIKPEVEILESLRTGKERILFVDDEEALVDLVRQMLQSLGYQAECMASSVEAMEVFRAHPEGFDLVITDLTMPDMTGDKLAKGIMEIRPDIPIILCTGFSERITKKEAREMGIREFIMKPFVMNDLANAIRRLLDKKRS